MAFCRAYFLGVERTAVCAYRYHPHSMEALELEDGRVIRRPVVRDPSRGVVFTRIFPEEPETSMIMFIRPGWEAMRRFLLREAVSHTYACHNHMTRDTPAQSSVYFRFLLQVSVSLLHAVVFKYT